MKFTFSYLLVLFGLFCSAQNRFEGIILDEDDNTPLEFVNVYSAKQSTISDENGKFSIGIATDSLYFYRPGYDKLATELHNIKDTIYLKRSLFKLEEVVVTNAKSVYQKIRDSVPTNYLLKPHTEKFFLRLVLRKNQKIVRLQDFYGKVARKTSIYSGGLELEKNDFQIYIAQMRKIGVDKDPNGFYFKFPSFNSVFRESVRINAMGPSFTITEKPLVVNEISKIEFELEDEKGPHKDFGHYFINGKDHAILTLNYNHLPNYKDDSKIDEQRSRLTKLNVAINFKKDLKKQLYYLNSAKRTLYYSIKNKDQEEWDSYIVSVNLYTIESFGKETVKSNIKEEKDVFKINKKYNRDFWANQNQLLLTQEMKGFISDYNRNTKKYNAISTISN